MLKVSQLSKTIKNKVILKELNFEIDTGKIAIFLGGSGVGKSTLLRVLNRLETYESGCFNLNGNPLDLTKEQSTHSVGMVFQHFNLFEHLNAEENMMISLTKCKRMPYAVAKSITDKLLEQYELSDHAKSKISNLSGGQKQRLAIARTLAMDPKIVCLDEPTSALDPRLTNQVAKYIKELAAENRIVLLTTHDMNLLEQLEGHLFLMEEGTIIENTAKSNYMANPTAYPRLQHFLKGVYR
jgi:polar amino acid transport system ATP-binding protein